MIDGLWGVSIAKMSKSIMISNIILFEKTLNLNFMDKEYIIKMEKTFKNN